MMPAVVKMVIAAQQPRADRHDALPRTPVRGNAPARGRLPARRPIDHRGWFQAEGKTEVLTSLPHPWTPPHFLQWGEAWRCVA